jgi:uncharacterized membrane protein
MPSSPPFIDRETGSLNINQLKAEALPLAGLIALIAGLALIPLFFAFLFGGSSGFGLIFTVAGQFILAVGTAIVLIYVVARGIQLADD